MCPYKDAMHTHTTTTSSNNNNNNSKSGHIFEMLGSNPQNRQEIQKGSQVCLAQVALPLSLSRFKLALRGCVGVNSVVSVI